MDNVSSGRGSGKQDSTSEGIIGPIPSDPSSSAMSTSLQQFESSHGMKPIPTIFKPTVVLRTKTWTRESHGLFDYESKHIEEKEFNMVDHFCVYRHETEIQVEQDSSAGSQETLARIINKNGQFYIDRPHPGSDRNLNSKYSKLWRVVKDVSGGLQIKEGDYMKLGRFKLKVRQLIASDNGTAQGASMAVSSTFQPKICTKEETESSVTCRICLMDGDDDGNDPLIKPCDCKGSIEYIHLECLRHWINGRLQIDRDQNGECPKGSYFFRPLACELCKTLYASHLKSNCAHDGEEREETIPIVELPKTKAPYVVLERDSHRPDEKGVHVISLADKNRLKLGRGHISDIRFNDVSISRWHATINFKPEDNTFFLEDHDSKFGTLLASKPPIMLDQELHFQAGRTVLQFQPILHPITETSSSDSTTEQ